ncbi:hypothetical protein EIP86_005581 [Pleurotus ostreatoroseus]|nr:hypothetical protein EIP86_005581 [Pleurotus ostreatoroseus]
MKAASAPSRTPNSQSPATSHHDEDHQYSHPHPVPPREPPPKQSSLTASLKAVFNRSPSRAPSSNSLHTSYSGTSSRRPQAQTSTANDFVPLHPYASMVAAPLPVVSSHDSSEDEDECPVCLEPLSFSFRLPGEKPHIVPECGHALHELEQMVHSGVELAALTGMGNVNDALFPGRDTPSSMRRAGPASAPVPKPYNPNADDPIDHHAGSVRSGGSQEQGQQGSYIVSPSIQVRSEFSTLTRSNDASQPLTCIVVVELPGKRPSGHIPGAVMPSSESLLQRGIRHAQQPSDMHSPSSSQSYGRGAFSPVSADDSNYSFSPTQSRDPMAGASTSPPPQQPLPPMQEEEDSPFQSITEDLRSRIIDWKGHPLSGLGTLQMYDLLSVRRDSIVREFFVYLFREAIICVMEERKRSLGRLLSSDGANGISLNAGNTRGVLRLKGRIYIRHIKQVTDTSSAGEMSLTIDMEDDRLDSFILIFKERSSLETWRAHVQSLVNLYQQQAIPAAVPQRAPDLEEFGGSQKAMRMLSGSTGTTVSTADSLLHSSSRSTASSNTSYGSGSMRMGLQNQPNKLSTLEEDEELSRYGTPAPLVAPHLSAGPSNSLQPLPHPPMDLIMVVSIPPPSATPSTAALKMRVIRTSLDFLVASLGTKDRLSLVTFEVGIGGRVRKTPFLCVGKTQSRARLMKFVDETGRREEGFIDEFLERTSHEDKTDVVTAVNHALDIVLQRKSKNSVSGMVLVSDTAETTRRAQMDLVLARAEAANIPIHSFGYGRSHDPASLWLMSNHTMGTYTFVRDWYDLRDSLAGCIGGMMSIALLNMKMHIKIVDGHRFRIRKVSGGPSAILSSDGRNVDLDIGEVHYGERKEMLVELELDNADALRMAGRGAAQRALSATDQFHQSLGLDALSISDSPDLADGMMDGMIDEVPVFEVDGSFYDPAACKHVSRLGHPVLLTVTLLPASNNPTPKSPSNSDPVIVRRRMELLASDMITRALVLVSRKNYAQAHKLLGETRRILHTVLQNITQSLPPPMPGREGGTTRNRKELLILSAVRVLQAMLQDMQLLSEALDDNVDLFIHDQRNFGAQQAMVLRDQKSWTGRSPIERLFWTIDNAIELVSRSTDWVARE